MAGLTGSWSISGTTATYKIGTTSVKITGLKSGLKVGSDGNIAGIEVDENSSTMTLSKSVLTNSDVSISGGDWALALNSNENFSVNTNAGGWLISGTTAYLLDGSSSGYELSNNDTKITYTAAKPGTNHLATISGLKEGLVTNTDSQIDGITVAGNTITVTSKDVLNKTALTLTTDKGYKLAVGTAAKPQVGETPVWKSKGTAASFTATMTYGYEVDSKGTTINYVAPKETTVTLSGLGKDLSSDVLNSGIDVADGVITLHNSVLNETKVTVKGADYALALADDVELANKVEPEWAKANNATKATLNQAVGKGYFSDGKSITYYKSDDNKPVVLATLSGLTQQSTLAELKSGVSVEGSVITLKNKSLFGNANITLGKSDAYDLALGTNDFDVQDVDAHWNFKSGKATIENGTTAGFEQKDGKNINYVKPTTTVLATVTGLPKDLETFYDEDEGTITGLEFTEATFDSDGKVSALGTITVSQGLLDAGKDVLIKEDTNKGIEKKEGIKKLTLGAKDNYYFLFDTTEDGKVEEPTDAEEGAVWTFGTKTERSGDVTGTGNADYKLDTSDGWAIDTSTKGASKTINYVAAKTTTLASVSGLTTDLLSDDDDGDFKLEENDDVYTGNVLYTGGEEKIYAIKVTAPSADAGGKITLNESVFGGKKITLKGSGYTLALDADYDVKDIAEADAKWKVDKSGKAVLAGGKSEGYVVDPKGVAINYTAAKVTALATITGLGKNLSDEDLQEILNEKGVTTAPTETASGTIKLNSSILTSGENHLTKVALGNKDNYTFKFDDTVTEYAATGAPTWELDAKNKANATYSAQMQSGYSGDGTKTVTYTEAPKDGATLATLSGLNKDTVAVSGGNIVYKDESTSAVTVEDGKINLLDSRVLGNKVTLKNGAGQNYTLALGDGLTDETLTDPQWSIEKSKATYYTGTSGGYAIDAKTSTTATYTKPTVTTTLATISGLKSDNTATEFEVKTVGNDKLIIITGDVLSTSTVSLKGDGYKLSLYGVEGPLTTDNGWTKNGANAVYTRDTSAGWTTSSDGKSITYSKEKTNEVVVTVSGITKDTVTDGTLNNNISLNKETNVVTVKDALLTTSNVTAKSGIKGETYKLALGNDVDQEAQTKDYWTIGGGKATYANGKTPYYTASASTITYHKPTVDATLATISGLKKNGVTESDLSLDTSTGVITIKDTAVDTSTDKAVTGTKVTLKNGKDQSYSLALGNGLTTAVTEDKWNLGSNKSTYERSVKTAGYLLSTDALSITYATTETRKTTLATLNGVKANPSNPTNGVITLTTAELNATKASLGNKDPYTLTLSNVAAPTVGGEWSISKGTATLKGTKTAGYLQTNDKTISYTAETAANKTEVLATIKGVTATALDSLQSGSTEISLKGTDLSNSVTVDGKGILGFNFGADYKDGKITGSASNDKITVAGTGLEVNPGKGNDYVDFKADRNTFVYTSGDGDDVIADFSASDKITISKNKKDPVVTTDNGNTVIDVDGKGSITLKGYTSSTVNINGADTPITSSADLLADDNYSMSAASLNEIVKPASDGYTPYDFNSALQLTKEDKFMTQLTYASNKK